MGDEELPAFPDGRKEKKKLLQKLTRAVIRDMYYEGMDLDERRFLDGPVATSLHAQIIPYLDDSIWQDDEPSAFSIGKILAGTVFGIDNTQKRHKDHLRLMRFISFDQWLEGHMKFAIDWTLEIVGRTKTNWAMPSRSRRHLESIITCEVARIQITGDTSAIRAPLNKDPTPMAHPRKTLPPTFLVRRRGNGV